MREGVLAICLIFIMVGTASAGVKHVEHHMKKDGTLVHEHHEIVPGGEPWQDWIKTDSKKQNNKLYNEPFGKTMTPPHNEYMEIDNQPELENFDSSPFDMN